MCVFVYRLVASFCSTFLTRKFMFSFFIFTGELQHLNGKYFNSEFVMENRIILFVNALVMRYSLKKTCNVHETGNVRFFTFVFLIKFIKSGVFLVTS